MTDEQNIEIETGDDEGLDVDTADQDADQDDGDASQDDDGESQAVDDTKKTDDENKEGFEPFPKQAKNAISRRDRQIAKLQAPMREMQQAQATQPQPTANQPPTQPGEPKEEDFVDYLDYFEAKVMHNLRKEMGAQSEQAKTAQEQQQQTAQYEQYVAQKMQQINTSVLEREKQSPGFQKAFQEAYEENAEILDYMPPEIERVFFEADDTALAFFNLANSGKLVEVMQMTPNRAAMEIAKAQMQPVAAQPAQPKQTAPAPISGARGTGKTQNGLSDLEGDELLERLASRADG